MSRRAAASVNLRKRWLFRRTSHRSKPAPGAAPRAGRNSAPALDPAKTPQRGAHPARPTACAFRASWRACSRGTAFLRHFGRAQRAGILDLALACAGDQRRPAAEVAKEPTGSPFCYMPTPHATIGKAAPPFKSRFCAAAVTKRQSGHTVSGLDANKSQIELSY